VFVHSIAVAKDGEVVVNFVFAIGVWRVWFCFPGNFLPISTPSIAVWDLIISHFDIDLLAVVDDGMGPTAKATIWRIAFESFESDFVPPEPSVLNRQLF